MPKNVYGHLEALGVPADEPLLADDEVRYKGQPIAVVAADDEAAAQEAVEAIEVDFEEREPLLDIRKAFDAGRAADPPLGQLVPVLRGPDRARTAVRSARATSTPAFDRPTSSSRASTVPPAIEHCPLETQVSLRPCPKPYGRLTIYSCTQAMYFSMGVVAAHLAGAAEQAQARRAARSAAGFGGKVDTATETL